MTESQEQQSQESAEQLKQESAQTADAVNSTDNPEPEQAAYDKKLDGPDRPSV